MGCVQPAAHASAEESWVALDAVRALSGNPSATSARYHRDGGRGFASDYNIRKTTLGEGMNGTVVLVTGRLDGQRYALKRLLKGSMSVHVKKYSQREAEIHLAVDHPHIASLVDLFETPKELALVTEFCAGGELFERVTEQGRFAEPDAMVATRQILSAVCYLHTHRIVHRDLKLENFLYQSNRQDAPLKLIDFGFAKVWGPEMPKMQTYCGSLAYISPDVLCGQGYTSKSDMWSVGVIVFILLSGYMPFSGDETGIQAAIREGMVDWRGKAWLRASKEATEFTKALLAFDPECRLDARTALTHPWLAQPAARGAPGLSEEVVLSMQEYASAPPLRRAALQLLARELLPEESRELKQLFLGLDRSNSGTISVRELADALGELRGESVDAGFGPHFAPCSTPQKAGHQSPSSVTTADTDPQDWPSIPSRGSLTSAGAELEEWSPSGSTASGSPADFDCTEAQELFRALDPNADGEAECSDFIAAALGSRPQLRSKAVRRAFARLDADRSGSIGAEDLRQALGCHFEGLEPKALLASAGVFLDGHGRVTPRTFAAMLGASQPWAL